MDMFLLFVVIFLCVLFGLGAGALALRCCSSSC